MEPLLGPVDLASVNGGWFYQNVLTGHRWHDAPDGVLSPTDNNGGRLDWIVVGGESGPGARPMHPEWARRLRDQCASAGVPFFMKQMGGANKARMPEIPADLMVREYPRPAGDR